MNGKLVGGAIVLSALITGAAVWYLQVYGFYDKLEATAPAAEIRLTSVVTGQPEPILAEGFEGIDADSSPLRFRSCFRTPLSLALLTETFEVYEAATPLNAPGWFGCFDAARIGADLEAGAAVAFLSEHDIKPGVDRVVAIYPDGRAYAWHQLNDEAEK
ncbi:DUF6446 family protein [Sedimentimonas flavescens]|uniref:DUF6446 family protein n=2 Tax=Rhodobacter group TaxID=3374108 RepID=A0ABT3A1S7_9RHOB|nr:DUF6446 family protein [Sedimentimonas flavescens]MCE5972658.1 DUF6446 family protein [Sinirhodobacter sp. WL0062]WBL32293.1 DUF6446 family protein [Sinirhodobacter sp. HNIBRBA609]MBW0156525.1 histidine kinase [Sedimentimonas flavescens]MCT2539016.1 DUF6446 family protein [Sedimentimonas flavescens]MCV2879540.1 DUF6446 family protein [Sedimentimonas flavescens]